MVTNIAKDNLEKDKNVLGKQWFSTYGNYFSDEENIQMFIDAVQPFLPNNPLDILYAASASGLLAERLLERLGKGQLTLVDISQKHLDENRNLKTKKICADLLEMDLGKQFDLIIMRSSLDYFPTKDLQIQVLKVLRKHLKPNGLFINQPAYIPIPTERDIVSLIYNTIDKIGKRLFQSADIDQLYSASDFQNPQKIGEGKIMTINEQDHIKRYSLNIEEIEIIQKILKESHLQSSYWHVTPNGYDLKFDFPIFLSHVNKT